MLEFVALELFREKSRWEYRFILATNMATGIGLRSLVEERSESGIRKLSAQLVKKARKEKAKNIDKRLFNRPRIVSTLARLKIIEFPDRFLAKSMEDEKFRQSLERLSKQLKVPRTPGTESKSGIIDRTPRINFNCSSNRHDYCNDSSVEGVLCHLGKGDWLAKRLVTLYLARRSPVLTIIRSSECGFRTHDIWYSHDISPVTAARTLGKCVSQMQYLKSRDLYAIMIPGTFDVVVADKYKLADKIKRSFSNKSKQYDLSIIPEFDDLGQELGIVLAREVLESIRITTKDSHFIPNEKAT
jgi:hypothetical protein